MGVIFRTCSDLPRQLQVYYTTDTELLGLECIFLDPRYELHTMLNRYSRELPLLSEERLNFKHNFQTPCPYHYKSVSMPLRESPIQQIVYPALH